MNSIVSLLLLTSVPLRVSGVRINQSQRNHLRNRVSALDSDLHVGIAELTSAANDIYTTEDGEFEFTPDNHIRVHIKEPEETSEKS